MTDQETDAKPDEATDTDEPAGADEPTDADESMETESTAAAVDDGDATAADSLGVGVVTIATDRGLDADPAGQAIVATLKTADHEIVTREHIGADHDRVQSIVSRMLDRDDIDVIVTGGATSVEPDDVTIEAVTPLIDKELTAFDELFTRLAYEAVGTRAVAARTLAGVTEGTPVFCLPGNEDAARLGLEEIILPEASYLVAIAREEIDESKWAVDEVDFDETEASDAPDAEGGETADGESGVESEDESADEPVSEVETEDELESSDGGA